jgi:hypothetical protein
MPACRGSLAHLHFEDEFTMSDAISALLRAVTAVREQIPRGELTVASVQRLLEAAERVCTEAGGMDGKPAEPGAPPAKAAKTAAQESKRQEARRRWAKIAAENEKEQRRIGSTAE